MSLDTELQVHLSRLVGDAVPVQQNYASSDSRQPRVWYQRYLQNVDLFTDGVRGMQDATYMVEVNAIDPDAGAAIYDLLIDRLNGHVGPFGEQTSVLGCFVSDAADDYQPRGLELDDGYHVFAFQLRVMS